MKFSKDPLPNSREYLFTKAKCLRLDLHVPFQAMAEEAKSLRSKFVLYRENDGYDHKGWWSLPIHGLGLDKPASWDAYGYANANEAARDLTWTEITDLCPVTVNWLKTVFPSKKFGRVRFMLLEPGGYISPHNDTTLSVTEAVNIALTNPTNCVWRWGDGTELDFAPGTAYAMNISYEHSVYNNSNEDRYHLIIHHHDSTPEWKSMMIKALEKNNESGDFYYSQDLY